MRSLLLAALVLASACASRSPLAAGDGERRVIQIGERSLSLRCKGEARGPTVILETGAAASSAIYWPLQDRLAEIAFTCTYDRAGLGWSDPVPAGRTFRGMAEDLEQVISRAGSVILVGHSMGGAIVRLAAARHRNVVGVVLVDATEEGFTFSPEGVAGNQQTALQLGRLASAAEAGLTDLVATQLPLPPGAPPEAVVMRRASVLRAGEDELRAFDRVAAEMRQPGGLGELGETPLVVVSRGRMAEPPTARDLAWRDGQKRLQALSSHSEQIIADRSGHNIHLDQPEAIVEAVRRLIRR